MVTIRAITDETRSLALPQGATRVLVYTRTFNAGRDANGRKRFWANATIVSSPGHVLGEFLVLDFNERSYKETMDAMTVSQSQSLPYVDIIIHRAGYGPDERFAIQHAAGRPIILPDVSPPVPPAEGKLQRRITFEPRGKKR